MVFHQELGSINFTARINYYRETGVSPQYFGVKGWPAVIGLKGKFAGFEVS